MTFTGNNRYYMSKDASYAMHTHSRFNQPASSQIIKTTGHEPVTQLTTNDELKAQLAKESLPRHEFFRIEARDGVVLDGRAHADDDDSGEDEGDDNG